jgi:hypothetical protein
MLKVVNRSAFDMQPATSAVAVCWRLDLSAPTLGRLLASTALPHCAPLGRVTTRLKLSQILGFVPWQRRHARHSEHASFKQPRFPKALDHQLRV